MSGAAGYLLLSTVACLALAALSLAVALRERARGSAWWWLPLSGGVLLVAACAIRLLVA